MLTTPKTTKTPKIRLTTPKTTKTPKTLLNTIKTPKFYKLHLIKNIAKFLS